MITERRIGVDSDRSSPVVEAATQGSYVPGSFLKVILRARLLQHLCPAVDYVDVMCKTPNQGGPEKSRETQISLEQMVNSSLFSCL